MYVLTEWLLSFNRQRFTLHKNERRNLELYGKIPSYTNLFNSPHISECCLLKLLPDMQSVNIYFVIFFHEKWSGFLL